MNTCIQYSFMSNYVVSILYLQILFKIWRSTGYIINIFLLSIFKKVKFNIYIYIHIILVKKLFNLVICSGEIESFDIILPKISSTLN